MSTATDTTIVNVDKEAAHFLDVVRYNIRRYMRLRGVTQQPLSEILHLTRPAVSQLLTGSSRLRMDQVFIIAQYLGVSMSDLMDETAYRQDEELRQRMHWDTKKAPVATRPRLDEVGPVGLEPTTGGL